MIPMRDGVRLSALILFPKDRPRRDLPTILAYNPYQTDGMIGAYAEYVHNALEGGYAVIFENVRGRYFSEGTFTFLTHAGADGYDSIDWISKQPWSDGQVGMYGGSYDGFTQWAATRKSHPALKTIVPSRAGNPGAGLPMENNVFLFLNYAWAFYTTNTKYLDNETYNDRQRWGPLNRKWYASGASYRKIDSIDGAPNGLALSCAAPTEQESTWAESRSQKCFDLVRRSAAQHGARLCENVLMIH